MKMIVLDIAGKIEKKGGIDAGSLDFEI